MFFKEWQRKRIIRKAFGKYIGKEAIDEILNKDNQPLQIEERKVLFFFIYISQDGDFLKKVERLLDALPMDLVVVEVITQGYIKASAGLLKFQEPQNFQDIKSSMLNTLQKSDAWFSVIYGTSDALVGNIGSNKKMSFGSVLPNFHSILTRLRELKEREIEEI